MQGRSQDTVLGQGPRVMGPREGKLREDVPMMQASLGPGRRQGASLGQHDPWTLLEEGKGEPGNKCVLASGGGGGPSGSTACVVGDCPCGKGRVETSDSPTTRGSKRKPQGLPGEWRRGRPPHPHLPRQPSLAPLTRWALEGDSGPADCQRSASATG